MRFIFTKPHKIITAIILVCFVLTPLFFFTTKTSAAPNYQMNYQGKLTNASNVAVPDGTYNMRFWLLTTSSIGTTSAVWTESLTGTNKVQVTNGLFSVMLGSTSPLTGVDFNQTLYLGVEIGGTSTPAWDGEMSPRKVLGTVPAAFEADKLDGLTSTQFVRTDATSSISASTADTLLSITQNGAGDLLNLFDGSDEVFSVIDGGNVGIGSTSPSRKFTVGGDAWFGGNLTATGTATFGALSISGASSFGYASTTGLTATYANFTNATTSNLKITGLTGSRALFTDADNLLTTSGVSQYLIDAITDETGTGSLVFSGNPLLAGFRSNASSTIGDGTQTGGLTINGGATTTGNAYFASNLGIGTTSPNARLTIAGVAGSQTPLIQTATSTGSTTFAVLASGDVEVAGNLVNAGVQWSGINTTNVSGGWQSVAYGNNLFVAVEGGGEVMVSSDGLNWIKNNGTGGGEFWYAVTYGNGIFVAVDGLAGSIMTSSNGTDWTPRTPASSTMPWLSVTYGNGTFVAVGENGGVMTSRDGVSWTTRTSATTTVEVNSVIYANGLFVAVGQNGFVMTSPDGIVWNQRTTGSTSRWMSVTYGNGLFVAVARSGTNLVMTSPDGITWTMRTVPATNQWMSVTYGNGLFVAVSQTGTDRVITSPDGINWTIRDTSYANPWQSVTYGNGLFVAVANANPDGNYQVITSGKFLTNALAHNNIYQGGMSILGGAFNIGTTTATTSTFANNVLNIASTTGTSLFTILNSGYVGIGSTSPSRLLTVNGDIYTPYNISAASSTITYASTTGLTVSGNTYLSGLSDGCLSTVSGLVTSSACSSGSASDWELTLGGGAITPTSTVGIAIFASSTIGDGTGAGGLTINGTATTTNLKITSLTASRALFTDADNLLTTSGVSQYLIDAITDETGTGSLVFSGNPLLAGFRSSASSTIGDGTQTGGLTISGGATTTGNAYIAGTLGIGSRNPSTTLEVVGIASSTFFYAGSGVAATPSITFGGDTNTGFYNPSADSIALVSGGALGLRTTNNQAHLFTNQIFSSFAAQIGDYSNGATAVNASIGSSGAGSASINAFAQGGLNATQPSAFAAAMYAAADGADENWWYGLINQRMGGTGWDNTPGALSMGDYIPGIGFAGQSGTTQGTHMELSAGIQGIIDSTVSSNVMPIGLIFSTSQTDESAIRERLRITSTGTIGIGTTSPNAKLAIHAQHSDTNTLLFSIASSTSNSTTTLFSVSNSGLASLTDLTVSGNTWFFDLSDGCLSTVSGLVTSSACSGGSASDWELTVGGGAITPTSTVGIAIFASSTIGDGTQTGGLTISGGATTTGNAYIAGNVGIGTTTPSALLTIGTTSVSGARVAGIKQHFGFVNSTQDAVYYGNETYITNVPTATSTLVGGMIRIADTSALGNTVRGFEAQAFRGTNTKGENTGLSGFGRTFGVRGTTLGDAGDTYLPAGIFAETQGTTQGNALRAYSGTITTEKLVSLFHDSSVFSGTGLQMNFGNAGGSFAATSSAKFLDLQVAGTSKFTISANGSTTIGDGVTSASLRIPFGGICVDNDGSCISTTTGQIRSVTSALGNSDLAETYFSSQTLHAGEIVSLSGGLSIKRAVEETEKDIIGVVSTKPGLTLGFDDTSLIPGEHTYPIGLKGRVPIKLSTENGPIKKGDRIALSSIPGVGMKATESSRVVGIALEDYDGTRAYTAGFLNQFGDDMYKEKVIAQKNTDPRAQDGCSYGGGNALGEAMCKREKVAKEKVTAPDEDTTREDTLRAFAQESALETRSADGEVVYVGQAIMFIELTNYQIAEETRVLSELASSTLLENGAEGETVWSRIKTLAQNFVDGVLTVTGIKAEKVEVTNELCVDGVCVTADDLRAILENAHKSPQNTNTNTDTDTNTDTHTGTDDDGEASVDPGTSSPPPSTEEISGGEGEVTESPPETNENSSTESEVVEENQETEPAPQPEPEQSPEPPTPSI